jgi:Fe-S cluster assembly iron-binding protein IscA
MVVSAPRAPSCLSYLIGPGAGSAGPRSGLRVGVANGGEAAAAVRLRLTVRTAEGATTPLAQIEVGLLLPRRSGHELDASIDWSGGRLTLGSSSVAFHSPPDGGAGQHVVRAELVDGGNTPAAALEVGVSRPADAGAQPTGRA